MTESAIAHCSGELLDDALREVPREGFLPAGLPLVSSAIGPSCPSSSAVHSLMEVAQIKPGERVLQIGTGSGYIAATIALVARSVVSIERQFRLAELARLRCEVLGYLNVEIYQDNGTYGWPHGAPYDLILISTTAVSPNPGLLHQLAVGGRLIASKIDETGSGGPLLQRITRTGHSAYCEEELGRCPIYSDAGREDASVRHLPLESPAARNERAEPDDARERRELRLAAAQRGLQVAGIDELTTELDIELFRSVPRAFLQRHQMIPIARHDDRVHVASCDLDAGPDVIRAAFPDSHIEIKLVTESDFRLLWAATELRAIGAQSELANPDSFRAEMAGPRQDADTHFVKLFETILVDAVKHRASDIHFERYGSGVRLRLRIDGELHENRRFHLTSADVVGLVNIAKIRGRMDIAERRLPQSGSIHVNVEGSPYDLRVQTQPSLHGEQAVIRLLSQARGLMTIDDLGFAPELAASYARLIQVPAGLLLVVGPTGSGKSTTLYAGLQELAADVTRKVLTIEDPIEYSVFGIQQVQVRPTIGFTFAQAMRSFVRLDPDVILLGEIRDHDSALEAIRASQTGHLVLSTLHSNDTADAVQRLLDLQLSPNSVASELLAVLAQRLAKRICERCSVDESPAPSLLREVFPDGPPAGLRFRVGTGCDACGGRGTYGRIAIYELLRADAALRAGISASAAVEDLRAISVRGGLVSLRSCLLDHVHAGRVPFSEARRLLQPEQLVERGA